MPSVAQAIQDGNTYVAGHIYALEDDTVRFLFGMYRRAFERMVTALNGVWNAQVGAGAWDANNVVARNELLQQILVEMGVLDREAADYILGQMIDSYRTGVYGTAWMLDNSVMRALAVQRGALLPLLPTEAIRAQVLAPYLGQTFLDRFADKRAEFELRIRRALVQSQIEGDGIYEAQRRIADELGIDTSTWTRFGPARRHRRDFFRTQLIARSELLRAGNNGALAVYARNQDVLSGWEYKTALDERVCPRCAPLDGRQFDFDNNPVDGKGNVSETLPPPIHPACRCTALPMLLDRGIEERIVGERETFTAWAARKGITQNMYGQAFDLRAAPPPKAKGA